MAWSFTPGIPVYIQIADRIRFSIISGEYPLGCQIPTVRQLAVESAVNPNTIQHAFATLEKDGIIETRGTMGRYVTENPEIIQLLKNEHAKHLVDGFLTSIKSIGYNNEQILLMIKEELE